MGESGGPLPEYSGPGQMKILVTAYDCPPMLGGIATFVGEMCRIMNQIPAVEIRLLARKVDGDEAYDQAQSYPIRRVNLSSRPEKSVIPLAREIRREILEWKPDVVLNFLWLPETISSYLVCGKTPYFIVAHGVEVIESKANLRKRMRSLFIPVKRWVFKRAKKVLCNSQFTAIEVAKNCGVSTSKMGLVYAAIPDECFSPGPKPAYLVDRYQLQGKNVIMTITRLVDYKGIDVTLSAVKLALEKIPNLVYLIGGVGEDVSRLRGLVEEYDLKKHVIFAGKIPGEELQDYYRLCDVFAMVSRNDYVTPNVEGFGLVYLEAAACGKAVIGGRSGGVSDAVEDGVSGILVDPLDKIALSEAIVSLFQNPEERERLGRLGRERVTKRFTSKSLALRILKEIEASVRN